MVLLKNAGRVLPLDDQKIRSVACIGTAAVNWQIGAAGSPEVTPFYSVSALAGIQKRAGSTIKVKYSPGNRIGAPVPQDVLQFDGKPGLQAEYFANRNLEGTPALVRIGRQV